MALPISGSHFDRIGKKLAEGLELAASEASELESVFVAYDAARQVVQDRLALLGHPPLTSRLKTTTTLVDKLKREPVSMRGIDDLAGVRVIIDGGRFKQDRAAKAVKEAFADNDKPPKIHDRRYGSSHGYRAVHIIVYVERIPVEIQLRTELQHMWAEITEKLGDKWGRGLRYGQGPDSPHISLAPGLTRQDLFDMIQRVADEVDQFEATAHRVSALDHELKSVGPPKGRSERRRAQELRDQISQGHAQLVIVEEGFRGTLRGLLAVCEQLEG